MQALSNGRWRPLLVQICAAGAACHGGGAAGVDSAVWRAHGHAAAWPPRRPAPGQRGAATSTAACPRQRTCAQPGGHALSGAVAAPRYLVPAAFGALLLALAAEGRLAGAARPTPGGAAACGDVTAGSPAACASSKAACRARSGESGSSLVSDTCKYLAHYSFHCFLQFVGYQSANGHYHQARWGGTGGTAAAGTRGRDESGNEFHSRLLPLPASGLPSESLWTTHRLLTALLAGTCCGRAKPGYGRLALLFLRHPRAELRLVFS